MEMIDYMEREAARLMDVCAADYRQAHDRLHRLLTLLIGGAGAVGSYVLTQTAVNAPFWRWIPLAVLALWWAGVACWVLWSGVKSSQLHYGSTPDALGRFFVKAGGKNFGAPDGDEDKKATLDSRLGVVQSRGEDIAEYQAATSRRLAMLNNAYKAVAVSPVAALILGAMARCGAG